MLASIMSLVFAMAHTCSLASRSPVLRPATLAAHTPGMASGTHALCTQQMQHLDSNQYHDATSDARPESGRMPRAHGGRSTRGLVGRTPFVLLPSSCGSTSGCRLTSCCMTAGELGPYNGVVLPQLARRPPRARFLLSRSDAGTLIVTLPSRGIKAATEQPLAYFLRFLLLTCFPLCPFLLLCTLSAVGFGFFELLFEGKPKVLTSIWTRLVQLPLLAAVNAPFSIRRLRPRNAILGCAGVAWLAARAFTSATFSVGEFQWEYKETFAGVITTCYRQGPVEELDIYLQDRQLELITGCKKICIGGNSQLSEAEANWVFQSISAVLAEASVPRS